MALACAAWALMRYSEQSVQACREGLSLCGNVIVPSLFPFFVLSSLVVELGLARCLGRAAEGLMWPLFRVGGAGASALTLGLIGGYPVGARTAIGLYESGQCSRDETLRLLAFCNNSGPAFIFGVVGAGVFASGRIGLCLYLVHALASLCVGILFRFYGEKGAPGRGRGAQFRATRFTAALTNSVKGAARSILNICAFVLLFTVIVRLLFVCGFMGLAARTVSALLSGMGVDLRMAEQLLTGLLEVSAGVTGLASLSGAGRLPMAAFLLGWAGLSVHCQVLSFLADSGLGAGTYLAGKLLHGALSALFTALLVRLWPVPTPVSGYLAGQLETLASVGFPQVLAVSALCAASIWLAFLLAGAAGRKKGWKSSRNGSIM